MFNGAPPDPTPCPPLGGRMSRHEIRAQQRHRSTSAALQLRLPTLRLFPDTHESSNNDAVSWKSAVHSCMPLAPVCHNLTGKRVVNVTLKLDVPMFHATIVCHSKTCRNLQSDFRPLRVCAYQPTFNFAMFLQTSSVHLHCKIEQGRLYSLKFELAYTS